MAGIGKKFIDGITSLVNSLANSRNAHNTNVITASRISDQEARAIYRTGIGSKIIRLKTGIALDDTLKFENKADEEFYKKHLQQRVKDAAKFQLAFGRGLVVLHEQGVSLNEPLRKTPDPSRVRHHVFSGDMVYVSAVNMDLNSVDYMRPTRYSVRGFTIHPSRVVDFRYVEPVELDAPEYRYGGISEFELIRNELVSDAVVQRAVPAILEKSSTLFYKLKGFKEALADQRESEILTFFEALETARSVYGAGIVDSDDEIEVHNQALTGLADSDMITLRRLAMVTGLPLSWLVGEAARGLNSTGEGERQVMRQTISSFQSDYLLDDINRLMALHGRGVVEFKEGLLETDTDRMETETKAIANSFILWQMGEDYDKYLERHGVTQADSWDEFFKADPEPDTGLSLEQLMAESVNEDETPN